jgi:hypothetical protein
MLIGRHGLRSELATYPIRFFGQNHAAACRSRCQRRRETTNPATHNQYVSLHFTHHA